MLLALLLALANGALAFVGSRVFRVPGVDINPLAIILIARHGDSVLFGALLLTLATLVSLSRAKYLWLTLPATVLIGYLALAVPSTVVLLIAYHLVCGISAFFLGFFGYRYGLFVLVNLGLNLLLARAIAF